MNYNSTRNAALRVTAAQAIAQGISEEGGLFVPQSFPKADLNDMLGLDYIGRAEYVQRCERHAVELRRHDVESRRALAVEGLYRLSRGGSRTERHGSRAEGGE